MSTEPGREVMAYVDGQLHGQELEAFLARLSGSADMQDEVAGHAELRDRICQAYGPGPEADESAFLLPLLNQPQVRVIGDRPARWSRMRPQWLAMAASLALGFGISQMLPLFQPAGLIGEKHGALIAGGELSASLEHRARRDLAQNAISLPVTFRTSTGFCRVFAVKDSLSGLACRHDGLWRIETVGNGSGTQPDSPYRQAGSDIPAPVMARVDALIKGDPMTEQEVGAAMGKGWRE